ncbi:MAG TPA: hypothetical protein VJJ02_04310 [Candidatus Paceibacterota bacterium]
MDTAVGSAINHMFVVVGVLVVFATGICACMCLAVHRIRMVETREQEAREGCARLLKTLQESRATVGHLSGEQTARELRLVTILHAVVELPLPPDLQSCHGNDITYLPRTFAKGDGRTEVMIPGVYKYAYTLHTDPKKQTREDRERIYEVLRHSKDARIELGIFLSVS